MAELLENTNLRVHIHRREKIVCPRIRYQFYFCCCIGYLAYSSWGGTVAHHGTKAQLRPLLRQTEQEVGQSYQASLTCQPDKDVLSLSRLHLLQTLWPSQKGAGRKPSVQTHDPSEMDVSCPILQWLARWEHRCLSWNEATESSRWHCTHTRKWHLHGMPVVGSIKATPGPKTKTVV